VVSGLPGFQAWKTRAAVWRVPGCWCGFPKRCQPCCRAGHGSISGPGPAGASSRHSRRGSGLCHSI